MKISVANRSGRRLDMADIRSDAKKVTRLAKSRGAAPEEIAIIFVRDSESRRINRRYRRKDRPANVLSFRYDGSGEIIIAPGVVRRGAIKNGLKFKQELRCLVVHGLVHLFGRHHEDSGRQAAAFERIERNILKHLKII